MADLLPGIWPWTFSSPGYVGNVASSQNKPATCTSERSNARMRSAYERARSKSFKGAVRGDQENIEQSGWMSVSAAVPPAGRKHRSSARCCSFPSAPYRLWARSHSRFSAARERREADAWRVTGRYADYLHTEPHHHQPIVQAAAGCDEHTLAGSALIGRVGHPALIRRSWERHMLLITLLSCCILSLFVNFSTLQA